MVLEIFYTLFYKFYFVFFFQKNKKEKYINLEIDTYQFGN